MFDLQVTYPKTDEQRRRLQEACRDILLFKSLDPVSGAFLLPSFNLNKRKHGLPKYIATAQYTKYKLKTI